MAAMDNAFYCGLDLGSEMVQASYYSWKARQPESISISREEQEFLMPAVLCKKTEASEWLAGEEAVRCASKGEGELVNGLFSRLLSGREAIIAGKKYSARQLMEQYLRWLLHMIEQCAGTAKFTVLAVTLPEAAEGLRAVLADIFSGLGVPKERLMFLSHTECFACYTVNMPPELWMNDVALFDYNEEGFYFERLRFARKRQPLPVVSERRDLTEELTLQDIARETPERKSYWFYNLAMQQLKKQQVTALYVTGSGFAGGWPEEALRMLCDGRRVFFGQNLYTKGACYAAKMAGDKSDRNFIFLNDHMIRDTISVRIYCDARNGYMELARAGTDYRQVGKKLRMILDDTNEIEFLVDNVLKKGPVHEVMILDNLIKRENKTIRLELTLFYADRDTPVVQLRDIGFGAEKATGRIWEQIL